MKRVGMLALILWAAFSGGALGQGMLIPKEESISPLAIKHQRVEIAIKDGVATARIEQVFKNSVDRDLEAVYVFPLPENASISDFAMYINGKRMSGELVEKDKARRIYEDIVRRTKDPGLLEHMGGNLFRLSVYPVPRNGEQRIEIEYAQALEFDAGLYKYVYPLKTGQTASRTLEDFTLSVRLNSSVPIKTVYSPSHEVGISRKSDHEAVIGMEEDRSLLDRDFVLYYGVSKKDFGLNLLTHAVKGADGFYMMMLAPSVEADEGKVMNKDVVFVFDTSGSMAGKKIEQARGALEYGVKTLNEGDRFNVIRFSTEVEPLSEALMEASGENREKALGFVGKIVARGGTAIDAALAAALGMDYDETRPRMVLFLTDGKPTIGESDTDRIVNNAKANNKGGKVRVFVFGVGEEVNIHLLDRVAGGNGGVCTYVKPGEDIELKVSGLADKMSNPVLTQVRIEIDKLRTHMVHPREFADLFRGDQLTVFGRYEGAADAAIRLIGEVAGKQREFVYEGTFPSERTENGFIPRLWATRRVGYLLDEIRLHGEEGELKDEVMQLSKEYGIMTPYTSYLVLEDDKAYVDQGVTRQRDRTEEPPAGEVVTRVGATPAPSRSGRAEAKDMEKDTGAMVPVFSGGAADAMSIPGPVVREDRVRVLAGKSEEVGDYMKRDSGRTAIELSEAIRRYKERETAGEDMAGVRHVGRKLFYLVDGRWVDGAYKADMKVREVAFGGEEYFAALRERPELKPCLALGERVIVVLDDGTALKVE